MSIFSRGEAADDFHRGYLKKGDVKLLNGEQFDPVVALVKHQCLYLLSPSRPHGQLQGNCEK
jgi:hypothetical protein